MERETPVEPKINEHLFHVAVQKQLPLSGTFELTPLCNFACKMCYVRRTAEELKNSPRKRLTPEQWLALAEQAREQGMLYLLLTGGEPFTYPHFAELYEALIRMGFLISINSNASLLDERLLGLFRKYPPVRINITLYGASDDTYKALCGAPGMFTRVVNNIRALREAGIQVKLNGSVTPENLADVPEIIRFAESEGLIFETNTYMFPPVRRDPTRIGENERFTPEQCAAADCEIFRLQNGDEWYTKRLAAIRRGVIPPPGLDESCIDPVDGKVRCRAGRASFWVTWDGWMTPCGMLPEPKTDVTAKRFSECWDDILLATSEIRTSGVCRTCPNQQLCHACPAMAYAETGTFSGVPRYLCEKVEALRAIAGSHLPETASGQSPENGLHS